MINFVLRSALYCANYNRWNRARVDNNLRSISPFISRIVEDLGGDGVGSIAGIEGLRVRCPVKPIGEHGDDKKVENERHKEGNTAFNHVVPICFGDGLFRASVHPK